MDTDRIMVAITAVYAIATIFITISNIVSADASRKQVKESRIQFDEMRRLSSLPFLQIELNGKKDCPVEYTLELPTGNKPTEDLFSQIGVLRNIGNGTAMNIVFSWDCKEAETSNVDSFFVNAIRYGESYKIELLSTKTEDDKEIKGNLTFDYQDLICNESEQTMHITFRGYDITIETDIPKLAFEPECSELE